MFAARAQDCPIEAPTFPFDEKSRFFKVDQNRQIYGEKLI
jgi:hypothetical protein